MSALFDIIRIPFGWFIQKMFSLTNSYIIAILLFAVVVKLLLFPFSIKQQKNSQKQAKLRPKENIIRKKYAGREDKATKLKLNTEIQELYQKENFNMLAGCLPLFLQMLVLLAVYAVIRTPLTYTAPIPGGATTAAAIKQSIAVMVYDDKESGENKYQNFEIKDFVNTTAKYDFASMSDEEKQKSKEEFIDLVGSGKFNLYAEINSLEFIRQNEDDFKRDASEKSFGLIPSTVDEILEDGVLPELELFDGFNLGEIPALSSLTDKEANAGKKLLLVIPLLTLITAYFGQSITKKYTYQSEVARDQESSMKVMNIFMPLFSLFISFNIPAAVSIYWFVQNVLGPVQQIALSKLYPIPEITEEELKEAERLYGGKSQKKKKQNTDGKKKRSLVYDDDDEYESVTSVSPKKSIKEKETKGDSIVEQSPLKKD